jgi:PAS domain-containing protein
MNVPLIASTLNPETLASFLNIMVQTVTDALYFFIADEPIKLAGDGSEDMAQIYRNLKLSLVNERAEIFGGKPQKELLAKNLAVLDWIDDSSLEIIIQRVLKDGAYVSDGPRLINGFEYYIESEFILIKDSAEAVVGLLLIERELTYYKQIENDLRNAYEDLLKTVYNHPYMIIMTDTVGLVTYVNYRTELESNLTFEQMTGKKISEITEVVEADNYLDLITIVNGVVAAGEASFVKTGSVLRIGGNDIPVMGVVSPIFSMKNEITGAFAILHDEKRDEGYSELETGEEQTIKTIEQLSEAGFWEYDLFQDKFWFSPRIFEIYGIEKPEGLLGQQALLDLQDKLNDIIAPEDKDILSSSFSKLLENLDGYDEIIRIMDKETGEYRKINIRAKMIYDDEGRPSKLAGLVSTLIKSGSSASEPQGPVTPPEPEIIRVPDYNLIELFDIPSAIVDKFGNIVKSNNALVKAAGPAASATGKNNAGLFRILLGDDIPVTELRTSLILAEYNKISGLRLPDDTPVTIVLKPYETGAAAESMVLAEFILPQEDKVPESAGEQMQPAAELTPEEFLGRYIQDKDAVRKMVGFLENPSLLKEEEKDSDPVETVDVSELVSKFIKFYIDTENEESDGVVSVSVESDITIRNKTKKTGDILNGMIKLSASAAGQNKEFYLIKNTIQDEACCLLFNI